MRIIKKSLLTYIIGEYATGARRAIDSKNIEQLGNHICKRVENKASAKVEGTKLLMYAGFAIKNLSPEQTIRFMQNPEVCFAMASLIIENFNRTETGSLAAKMGQFIRTIESALHAAVHI